MSQNTAVFSTMFRHAGCGQQRLEVRQHPARLNGNVAFSYCPAGGELAGENTRLSP
jgi:hypothetical protein